MTTSEPCQQTLFDGMELDPSTPSAEAFLARTCPTLESALASRVSDLVYGRSTPDLLAKFDPASRSWKTSQVSLVPGMDEYSETWPRSGMMRGGTVSQLPPLAPLTGETGSGLLPSPTSAANMMAPSMQKWAAHRNLWPTPAASEARLGYQRRDSGKKGTQKSLTTIVIDEERRLAANQFATSQARDYRTGSTDRWDNPERSRNLNDQIGGSLSADWVEALMGFPTGWTVISEEE